MASAVLRRAIEAEEDALYQQEPTPGSPEPGCSAEHPSPRQARLEARRRRADAMGLLAGRALAAGGAAPPVVGPRAVGGDQPPEPALSSRCPRQSREQSDPRRADGRRRAGGAHAHSTYWVTSGASCGTSGSPAATSAR